MDDFLPPQVIFDGEGVPEADFTAAATDIITSNTHGLSAGDLIQVTTDGADLPAGLAVTTDYYVIDPTTNTFKVSATLGGTAVDITDAGTGTHTFHLKGKTILTLGFRHMFLTLNTSDSANYTAKVQGSRQEDKPDFNTAQSKINSWDYVQAKDTEDASTIDGDVGFAPAGADDHRNLTINVDGMRWVTVVFTAWTAGKLRATLSLSNG